MGAIMNLYFNLGNDRFLNRACIGYSHQYYTKYGNCNNPDFLVDLKNTYDKRNSETAKKLVSAKLQLVPILERAIPLLIAKEQLEKPLIIIVPRAKALSCYSYYQLGFKHIVEEFAQNSNLVENGTDMITRHTTTATTHLIKHYEKIGKPLDGEKPYPGITLDTCHIDERVKGRNIILIDDIYTKTIGIDEDCIQALYTKGANKIVLYTIGHTKKIY